MSTTKALKKLYKAITGENPPENVNTIAKLISWIADKWDASTDKELPAVTSEDNGKILSVSSGKWNKNDAPVELPVVTAADNGNVLKVVEGVWTKSTEMTELPAHTSADSGKVLGVTAEGTLEWKTLS